LTLQVSLAGIIVLLSAGLLSAIVIRRISRPIGELKESAHALAAGDLNQPIPPSNVKEVGELAEAMNQMAATLDERYQTIVRQRSFQSIILASMTEGIVVFDDEERLVSLNEAAERILDVKTEDVRGVSLPEAVRNPQLQRIVRDTLSTREPGQSVVTIIDGEERVALATTALLQETGDNERGVLLVLNEITEQSRAEKIRRDFVANVSHELRTPITSILGSAETLLDGAKDNPEDLDRFLQIISRQAKRLDDLAADLRDLAHIENLSDIGEVEMSSVSVSNLLGSAVSDCETIATGKDITVTSECSDNLSVQGDPQLLEQAVVNLIDNAIKYSEPGNSVKLEGLQVEDTVRIRVTDNGHGIAAHHLPRIFERFYRAENSRSREYGGTGLGLAIVKHIARAHGGQVKVDSVRGRGSTFEISLPASHQS
jgi:two-component system phosphate regulon sensor histidine kinase PhoR